MNLSNQELIDEYIKKERQTLQKMLEKSRMNLCIRQQKRTQTKIKGLIELKFLLYINSKINQFNNCKKETYVPPSSRNIAKILNCSHTWIQMLFKKYSIVFTRWTNKIKWKWKWCKNVGIKVAWYFLKGPNNILDFEKLKPLNVYLLKDFKYAKYQKQWFEDVEYEFKNWLFNDFSTGEYEEQEKQKLKAINKLDKNNH